MNMPEMNIEEWQKPDGFLSFRHNTHPDYLNGFGDNVDTTAIWLTQCKMNQTKTDAEIKGILTAGLDRRAVIEQGVVVKVVRTPGDPQEIGKDQLDYLVPLCRSLGLTRWADRLVDLYGDTKLPHRRDHLKGSNTFFGMLFEMADSIIDRWSNSMPSKMNNLSLSFGLIQIILLSLTFYISVGLNHSCPKIYYKVHTPFDPNIEKLYISVYQIFHILNYL